MTGHVHVDRSREPELPALQDDRVFVLCDAIDRTIECPVEDDARRFAAHARIVLREEHRELFGTFLALRCELGTLNDARTAATCAARPSDSPFSRLYWLAVLRGTRAPPRPRGSVITSCSGAQSPVMFGSPVARRAARVAVAGGALS